MKPPLRFDDYVEQCLYASGTGFYSSGVGRAGRRTGDFITSPEVGPLFGAVLANAIDQWWDDLGRPDPFPVVDVGSGPGTLLRALEFASPRCAVAWELRSVDLAPGTTAQHSSELGQLDGAVVIANELLDNLPFRVVERTAEGWSEVYVEAGAEVLLPLDIAPFGTETIELEAGQRAPLLEQAQRWVESVRSAGAAHLLAFDYGASTTAELASRGGWLRTYRQHERGDDPYDQPGERDITTDIAIDQLPGPSGLETQAAFLRTWGIDELVEEGRRVWKKNAAAPNVAALRMRSRVTEAEALLDPAGLGSWLAVHWC
ncbi:MAG: SAM-dependent MidA family methyltransferase [Acidimicrobiales bacterium]|jgi:SAM-dependent MidA family methyltransferase